MRPFRLSCWRLSAFLLCQKTNDRPVCPRRESCRPGAGAIGPPDRPSQATARTPILALAECQLPALVLTRAYGPFGVVGCILETVHGPGLLCLLRLVATHWMNFAKIRMGRLGRDDALRFRAVVHPRPTKPGVRLYVRETGPSVLGRFAPGSSRPCVRTTALFSTPASETAEQFPLPSHSRVH